METCVGLIQVWIKVAVPPGTTFFIYTPLDAQSTPVLVGLIGITDSPHHSKKKLVCVYLHIAW